mmetsp:Transcript_17341/g.45263  ORF Transcript_17341/g.45263 Transcript_17341/m.45263 type:complete len:139 (+) Transcript_17341:71-487(+)
MAAAGPTEAELAKMDKSVVDLLEQLRKVGLSVLQFEGAAQRGLYDGVNGVAERLHAIDQMAPAFSSVDISQDLLRYIDEGKSPELFLKACFDKVESSSASQQDTSAGFADFRDMLLAEVAAEWPEAKGSMPQPGDGGR